MKNPERYRHLRVDWVGEALNVCGLGPESLRELFDTLRVFGPSEVWGCRWICRISRNSTNRVGAFVLIDPYKKTRSSPPWRGGYLQFLSSVFWLIYPQ